MCVYVGGGVGWGVGGGGQGLENAVGSMCVFGTRNFQLQSL